MQQSKLHFKSLRVSQTKDYFFKLEYTGKNKYGDEYSVVHECPPSLTQEEAIKALNDLIESVLSEARQLYGN